MQSQDRSDKEETDQRLERASLQELRVRRTSPVPDARDAYDELRQRILQILSSEIGRPNFGDGIAARAFIQAQLDTILRQEKIILNRREKRQLSQDTMAALLSASQAAAPKMPAIKTANTHSIEPFFAETLAGRGADLLRAAVAKRRNILIAGKTAAGKTTLLRALCSLIPADERVITIEETAEPLLDHPHLVSLQRLDPSARQQGDIPAHKFILAAARTRNYRLILDSLQGAETYTWLQAVNARRRGSMATCLALSPQDALARLEAMAGKAGNAPAEELHKQIELAIDLIVYVERAPDGPPHIVSVCGIAGFEKEEFKTVSFI